ncbi:hypothetical protein DLAC_06631 [Tieghemostelium lacteum]|uniref:Trafficking protein particle complex subunit 6B n=1 Tax=Tieghemostelium lacteum TaxID=361077 RepID=A0A151ZFC4_TIELA|nr:hypothetical protein DLAC_06631 [Tieghemostelium lacteum]|eukprot:KYQ92635.1 hypothetical protein DLAC_06631 [Tieghemostelium lacteum]
MSDPLGGTNRSSTSVPNATPNVVPNIAISSISAQNSPINNNYITDQVKTPTSSTSGGTTLPTSTSNTNLGSLVSTAIPHAPASRSIAISCFEFFYIEMVDYLMKSCQDKVKAYKKLDKLGFKVGNRLVERLSIETPLFTELLEAVKFICKVFWFALFKKSIDNLRTNHKGVFVLSDKQFQWLQHLSYDPNSTNKDCTEYIQFACGLIKGAMSNFGYKCTVTFELLQNHACMYKFY